MSSISLGLKFSKTIFDPFGYGFDTVKGTVFTKPCVLTLGGGGARVERDGNGYASIIYDIVADKSDIELKDICIYGAWYNFDRKAHELYNDKYERYETYTLGPQLEFIKANMPINTYSQLKIKSLYLEQYNGALMAPLMQEKISEQKRITPNMLNYVSKNIDEQYIEDLFTKAFLYRIQDFETKQKLPIQEVCKKLRLITIMTHCHGAYVAFKIEQKIKQKMKDLGFTTSEIKLAVSQLLIVAQNPLAPVTKFDSTFIGFGSVYDQHANFSENRFKFYCRDIINEHKEIKPCFLPKKMGNLFFVTRKVETQSQPTDKKYALSISEAEHMIECPSEMCQTSDGVLLDKYFSNIIINGLKNSIEQRNGFVPLPPLSKLVKNTTNNPKNTPQIPFDEMVKNGEEFTKLMRDEISDYLQHVKRVRLGTEK